MMCLAALVVFSAQATTPLEFGLHEIRAAAGARYADVKVSVKKTGEKESYKITSAGGKVQIVGSDQNGAMYGCFEFAERLRNQGSKAWSTRASGSPFLVDRGLNLFLTLPWDYKKNDTDYDVAALSDPQRWWFQNDDYWTTLLDIMAKSRLNWLDIHGGWDISVTNAPNLYAYFVTSPSFPKVGVPDSVKAVGMARLNKVIAMAHARGIRVSLMAYEANLRIPQNPNPPYEATEANVYKYTKEAVEQMIRQAPGLDAIGFRIGESGKSESFFKCYGEAVKNSGRHIPLITRSWITTKQKVLPLAQASKDFTVEIKYNGEQWGAPYMVSGGRMANWSSYSFEDYLSDSGDKSQNTKTWPGQPDGQGGQWPSEPYKIVWQVRANGTHRIFPFYNPDWVRRSIKVMKIGTASGYTIEGEDAYYPKAPDYYLADIKDKYCNWVHQRDEMYWMTWGRLGYDPKVPDDVFDAKVKSWFPGRGDGILKAWREASLVVPLSFMANSIGPDHRDHAPELEWGGSTMSLIDAQPFDSFSVRPIVEDALQDNLGVHDGRVSVAQVGHELRKAFESGTRALGVPRGPTGRGRELSYSTTMLLEWARFQSGRYLTAGQIADALRTTGKPGLRDSTQASASQGWRGLTDSAESAFYRPFTEKLRMHTNTFHWKSQDQTVKDDLAAVRALPVVKTKEVAREGNAFSKLNLDSTWTATKVKCRVAVMGASDAWLLWKPLPSSTFFHRIPMRLSGREASIEIPRMACGMCVAVELKRVNGGFVRVPAPLYTSEPAYQIVPALSEQTPQIYNTSEALTYLDPSSLKPEKHGKIMIAPRGWTFFNRFDKANKRKLLDPVKRGMDLVILQQDFASGRYKLDFLPSPPKIENNPSPDVFDPARALGMSKVSTPGVLWQRIAPTPGWKVYGNGGVASYELGKGHVWVVLGRFMQLAEIPGCAENIKALLKSNGHDKPVVLVDAGTESSAYTTSFWPDTMNVLNVPFLTLGEVIAKEQGMNSFKPIAGPVSDDDVLGGKGKEMANAFLRKQVVSMSKRTPPTTVAAFELERKRRKAELLKSLGLDPIPPKTPLNARITGVIQRPGYKIEKLVFESRPRFYVTCHVYKSDSAPAGKLPVIVDVNGHWAHKKGEDRLQLRCAFQALRGYLVIAVDSPGHSFEGNSLIERRSEGDHNDFMLVEGGSNATGYYVWDAIRALDYMATRPDADMGHIGLTGASGGGLATLYTFAADDRYSAAVPVVYMASMEQAPDNGCLCNHVPGTCQIGDRSDVLAIQAPKPVYIMGAQNDGEFPPGATLLTHKKVQKEWALFGKESDTLVQVFAGPHDYNQPMREAMVGFFDKYLKGVGDGSPVPQPPIEVFDPEDRQFLVLDPPMDRERTMRDLSKEYLDTAPASVPANRALEVNGGVPARSGLKYRENGDGQKRSVTFESEPGLVTPGVLFVPAGKVKGVRIYVSDNGKQAEIADRSGEVPAADGYVQLFIDVLGTGELADIELRYPVYMGRSVPFIGGWQLVRAAEAMHKYSGKIEVIGKGPACSQAVMFAGLMDDSFAKVTGLDCMAKWADVFGSAVPDFAVQPRAHLCGSLADLRKKVKNSTWSVRL